MVVRLLRMRMLPSKSNQLIREHLEAFRRSPEFPWLLMCSVALVVVIYLSLSNWQEVRVVNGYARARQQMLHQLNALSASIEEAQSGQRGYLLTRIPTYLASYEESLRKLPQQLAVVKRMSQD